MAVEERALAGVRVLVVDDHEDMQELFKVWLEGAGAEVSVSSNGMSALETIVRVAPDVVVCDLHMPRMDGAEFVRRLRELTEVGRIPVIAVTGSSSDRAVVATMDAGFNAHLVKPVLRNGLMAQVSRELGR
jgi:CheY-like chemotaxis protein